MPRGILIVDDNSVMRRLLRAVFKQPDWEICGEAVNGREGIEKAQQLQPSLIVLDLSMPVMNGLEAAPVLKRMMPAVPIILYTLHDQGVKREALSAGVNAVVSKAAPLKALINQAEDLLRAA